MKVILGTKIGMTQIISEDGIVTPVTILQAGPVTVTQIKTTETDGYNAVQLGYGQGKNLSKSVSGHVKKAGENVNPKILKEFRTDSTPELKLGDQLTVESFEIGDKVAVSGISKGKGFAGTVKRCTHKKSGRASVCQVVWAMIRLQLRTSSSLTSTKKRISSVLRAQSLALRRVS